MNRVPVAILAGGASRRMGRDKALLQHQGRSWLEHLHAVARQAGGDPLIVGRRPGPGEAWRGIVDRQPGSGPLGGLITALLHLRSALVLLAVDMPLLDAEALAWLLRQALGAEDAGGVAVLDGQVQPCFARYTPAILPLAEARLAAGRRSLRGLAAEARCIHWPVPTKLAPRLCNCNRPEEVPEG